MSKWHSRPRGLGHMREGSWCGISMESGGKGSFQAAKLQRSARTTVCSHSTGDMAAMRSIESKQDHKRYSGECLSYCEHLLSGGKNERPDALFSQAVAPLVTFIRGNGCFHAAWYDLGRPRSHSDAGKRHRKNCEQPLICNAVGNPAQREFCTNHDSRIMPHRSPVTQPHTTSTKRVCLF